MITSTLNRNGWMWRTVANEEVLSINHTTLEPSTVVVSSTSACRFLCSYSWQSWEDVRIPGHAPIWQDVALPVTLAEDKESYTEDPTTLSVPTYPFEPLFRATASMQPGFRFDNVDIVANRNSLRKIFDFCCGRSQECFRLNLLLVHNSLFIERCEKNASRLIRGSQNSGWGRNFERNFTKLPFGEEGSTSHHRVLEYEVGDLRCVVRFEVDAFYKNEETEKSASSADPKHSETAAGPFSAAELKARVKAGGLSKYLPQLWFGRTPWLIIGRHDNGTFGEIKITNASDHFAEWEAKYQTELQKLVTTLSQLRKAVRKADGRNCVAIYEQDPKSKTIKIFPSLEGKRPLPEQSIPDFWDCAVGNFATHICHSKREVAGQVE